MSTVKENVPMSEEEGKFVLIQDPPLKVPILLDPPSVVPTLLDQALLVT